jgi:phage replication-related protein YjqB (UPF0714/DUF867 family)
MIMADKYSTFDQLANFEQENVDFQILCRARDSDTVIIAPHGGNIEPGTTEIAYAVAADDFSFYAFEGIKPSRNRDLHITSALFNEPRCIDLIKSSARVITIHGQESDEEVVYLGGDDKTTGADIYRVLSAQNFAVQPTQPGLHGSNPSNICNRGLSGAGVQLEVAYGLRKSFFASLDKAGREKPTQRFREFVAMIREVLIDNRS